MRKGYYMVNIYEEVRYGEVFKMEKNEYQVPSTTTITTKTGQNIKLTYDAFSASYRSADGEIVLDVKDYIKKQIQNASTRKIVKKEFVPRLLH